MVLNQLTEVGGGKAIEHPKGIPFFTTGGAEWHHQEGKGVKETDDLMYVPYASTHASTFVACDAGGFLHCTLKNAIGVHDLSHPIVWTKSEQ